MAARKANQLKGNNNCSRGSNVNLTSSSQNITRSAVIRNVALRLIQGEPIPDVKAELSSLLYSKKYKWEDNTQKDDNLQRYAKIIEEFVKTETNKDHTYLDGIDPYVDVFGEMIDATPDFIRENEDGSVSMVKITTGNVNYANLGSYEDAEPYAYTKLGQKIYGENTPVYVEYIYLGVNDTRNTNDYFNENKQIKELLISNSDMHKYERYYEEQKNNPTECSAEACASCAKKNICHYEEPPVAMNIEETVRPVSEIRLTNAQRQIVDYEYGTARVNAGAGAGKTLVVALRVAELLSKGYEPEDFCLLTFTKAGAEEMTARVMSYAAAKGVPLDPERFSSGTINSFCNNIIKEHYQELGYGRPPRILPDEMRYALIHDIIGNKMPKVSIWKYTTYHDQLKFNPYAKGIAINEACKYFTEIKENNYTRDNHPWSGQRSEDLDIIFSAYDMFNKELKSRNLIEYADQLKIVMAYSEAHPNLFEEMGYKHIIVDEFQDTDYDQIQLLNKMIDTQCFKSFMAVGDDSQSIFGFRHTSPEYMINFESYFGRFDDFTLAENHRSNKATIDFANQVNALANEKVDKDLIATKLDGNAPQIRGYYTKKQEYEAIADDIKQRWENGERDIAVIASTKVELKEIASILTQKGIPSTLMCPLPYMENSRVAALQTFYSSFFSGTTQGFADYQNILQHGLLKDMNSDDIVKVAENFQNELKEEKRSLSTFLKFAKALDEQETDACYQSFLEKLEFCEDTKELTEFMNSFNLYGANSEFKREGKYEGVCLTTVHSSKGLEWDTTYLSLSKFDKKAYHSNSRSYRRSRDYDENIRKWFVGATRARKELIMTGEYLLQKPSARYQPIFNDFVLETYKMLGRAFGYNFASYQAQVELEKSEMVEKALKGSEFASTLQPVNRNNTKEKPSNTIAFDATLEK